MYATKNNYETVIMNNIMLADGMNETNYKNYLDKIATQTMDPTADIAFYEALNKQSDAKIKYCVELTNNMYGNGYSINANNITFAKEKYGYRVFNGPLDLVALKYGNISDQNAKVKSQDNIIFVVKKDGINITNVELKGCSDSSIIQNNQTNIGALDYCGTVLEIIGDNCNLAYSMVNNGRTVVRIYGRAHEGDLNKIITSF